MIFRTAPLTNLDAAVLHLVGEQREQLQFRTQHAPRRWLGSLRRMAFARAIQGSNSIEGINASMEDAVAAVENEQPSEEGAAVWRDLIGYRNAMTYIIQTSQDPHFLFSGQFLKSLHFMMLGHDLASYPGQWRPGGILVADQRTGISVYEAPSADQVNSLMEELVGELQAKSAEPAIVRAAMAHLNLTMVHPFKDGNGRMARALQTLVLAREGILHPAFSSIEEWLGRNTAEYYRVLKLVGGGTWNPGRNALPWVRFCLKAHYQQAATLIRRNEEAESLWSRLEKITKDERLPERSLVALFNAALGLRMTNPRYRADAEVTEFVASRDLKRLSDIGLLAPTGQKRGRSYTAAPKLQAIRTEIRIRRPLADPYALARERVRKAPKPLRPPASRR